MKKLDIKLGGHNFTGDDLLFLQSSLNEAFIAFIQAFMGDYVILSGIVYTNAAGTLSWTAGWLYMQGEIFQVDAGSTPVSGNPAWEIVETYDPAGNQQYEDLNIEDTYVIRKAAATATGGGAYLWTTARRLGAWKNWAVLTYNGAWNASGTAPLAGMNIIGDVIMRGTVTVASYSAGTDTVICTLSTTLRPQELRTVAAPALINGAKTFIHLQIDTTGEVKPLGLSGTDAVFVYLDGVRFVT
ncbi:hypothetical protein [Aurantibacillus circumpalustris]|uniref:hypothetical protein n=1 Tax=Aurantibacillus circumpalustris TaxID=3036359 RepID=UPI00295AFD84|nr:hypothetical protein [Aurantibacillus circumpalustris]